MVKIKGIIIILSLLIAGSYYTYLRLLSVTGGHEAEGLSIGGVLFAIMCLCCILYYFKNWKNISDGYVFVILGYFLLFIFNTQYYNDVTSTYVLQNSLWVASSLGGYAIGRKYYTNESLSKIAFFIILPLILLLIYSMPNTLAKVFSESLVSDCFFICCIFTPVAYLISSSKTKYLCVFFLLALCFLSMKRTLVITSILSVMIIIFSENNIKKNYMKALLFICISLCAFLVLYSGEQLFDYTFVRFNEISTDGGSGRNEMYSKLVNDIYYNYNTFDILFGRGCMSVSSLLGINAHMDILQILHSFGIISLTLYFGIYVFFYKEIRKYQLSFRTESDNRLITSARICLMNLALIGNLNCLIINPPLIIPLMFITSYLIGCMKQNSNIKTKIDTAFIC